MTALQKVAEIYLQMTRPPAGTVKELARTYGLNYLSLHNTIGRARDKIASQPTKKQHERQ